MKKYLLCMLMALPFVFTSCSDSDDNDDNDENGIKLEKSEYKMNFQDKVQIEATSPSDIVYQSENEYVATVSTSGLITGGRVGETEIALSNGNGTKKVKVIIEPKSELYPEPEFPFGETRDNIIKKHGKPDAEDDESIVYKNYSSNTEAIMYMFDGKEGKSKLTGISVLLKSSYSNTKELAAHLAERYIMTSGEGDLTLIGMNSSKVENATVLVGVQLFGSYWGVMYVPYSKGAKSSLMSDSFQLTSVMRSNLLKYTK